MIIRRLLDKLAGRLSCGEILEVLQGYLDGEIDAETAQKVAQHLDACSHCEKESLLYQQIKDSLASRRQPVDPVVLAKLETFGRKILSEQPGI